METKFSFRPAKPDDKNAIKKFLESCQLPTDDITTAHLEHFIIIRQRNKMIATVGMEIRESYGLLRSLAVAQSHRGQNLGIAMTQIIEDQTRAERLKEIYLLTTTASPFFAKQGYRAIQREKAPAEIQATEEFKSI